MNINFNPFSSRFFTLFQQNILRPLTDWEKKITFIATLAIGCTVALLLVKRCLLDSQNKIEKTADSKNDHEVQSELVKEKGKKVDIEGDDNVLDDTVLDNAVAPDSSSRVILVAHKALFMEHLTGKSHPEAPRRVEAIEKALRDAGLMDNKNTVLPRKATEAEISLCHDKAYQNELKNQIKNLHLQNKESSNFDNSHLSVDYVPGDFNISQKTLQVSLYAAGAPLTAIEIILNEENQISSAFCIVRPPGHHAHQHTGSGFCVFNNVAIAAKHLTQNLSFNRVLIVDWDAHHGDGTQELAKGDPKIFYFSTHQDTSYGFYPGPHWGQPEPQGIGLKRGC